MADIEKIIKALQGIEDTKGGGAKEDRRRETAKLAKEELKNKEKNNKATTKELKLKIEAYRQAQRFFKAGTKEYELLEDQIKSKQKLIKANEEYVETIRKVGSAFVGLGKAAYRGTGSISDFTDNIYGLQTVGRVFDTNLETFRQLSMVGANFGKSIVDLRAAAHEAALPLDDFAKLVGSNAESLAAMFGSTTQGARGIATLGRQARELGIDRLAPLGFTVDEINETLLLNLDSQRRAGKLDSMSTDQRIASSLAFAEQLDRLAKLTGQQRDELRKAIEQQQTNERFQAFLQGQTAETGNRLRAFAGTVEGISPDLAEGFQDLIANAGVPITESALALVQNMPGARDVIQDLISGVVTREQAMVKIRDLSAGSIDRFRQATVTGQVEFLRLQGGIINLGRRVTDTGAVLDEQTASGTSLVKNLTTFEQATKVLSSKFQSIETGLLQAFGPALGGIMGSIQGLFAKGGSLATALAKAPSLTAGLIVGGLTGKFLFNKAAQIGIIGAGTRIGTAHMNPKIATAAGLAKGGAKYAGKGIGAAAGLGMGVGGVLQAGSAETTGGKAMGVGTAALGGAMTGAMVGSMIPVVGTIIGGAIGAALGGGSALFAASQNPNNKKEFGGPMEGGKTYLVGEKGPELVTPNTKSTVTANQDLKRTFDTQALETKMTSMVTELNAANKTLSNMVNGVNTLVAVESRALKAHEKNARKDVNQVGIV